METCRALIRSAYCGEPRAGFAHVGFEESGVQVAVPMCADHLHLVARGVLPMPCCTECRWRLRGPEGS